MEDKRIIELFFQRSETALTLTREKYGDLCARVAGNMLFDPEDAEECVNDAMLALWNTIPPAKPQLLGPFVARITRNLARNRIAYNTAKKRAEAATVSLGELDACLVGREDVQHQVEQKELTAAIEAFLHTLDEESRNIFLRRYWFFDTVEQIAAGMGLGHSKVKMRLLRTRTKLRAYLIKEGFLDE